MLSIRFQILVLLFLKRVPVSFAYKAGYEKEFLTLENVEKITPGLIKEMKGEGNDVCANVDLYSGLVYKVLGIPEDLYTPLLQVPESLAGVRIE